MTVTEEWRTGTTPPDPVVLRLEDLTPGSRLWSTSRSISSPSKASQIGLARSPATVPSIRHLCDGRARRPQPVAAVASA
jgi:hypothetical protein